MITDKATQYNVYFSVNPGDLVEDPQVMVSRAKALSTIFNDATTDIAGLNFLCSGVGGAIDPDGRPCSDTAMHFSVISYDPEGEAKVIEIAAKVKDICGLESVFITRVAVDVIII
jgi:hypothetical protein